jgi:hypothetical protein
MVIVTPKLQTEELCLIAVKKHPIAIKFISLQTLKICLHVVKQNGYYIQYVESKFQTHEVCLEAFKKSSTFIFRYKTPISFHG